MTKPFRVYLLLSVIFSCIGSALLLVVPLVSTSGSTLVKAGAYVLAGTFWLSIVFELFSVFRCSKERQRLEQKLYHSRRVKYAMPGVVSFFKSYEATVADILLFISAIAIAVILWIRAGNEWAIVSFVSLFFLSFNMHCLFNGRNYRFYKLLKAKSREELDQYE